MQWRSWLARAKRALSPLGRFLVRAWRRFRKLATWLQAIIALVVIVALLALGSFLAHLGASSATSTTTPTVTLESIATLSGNATSVGVIGTVDSVSEADILAQSAGTVTAVHAKVGSTIGAGAVIAELDNASQRAALLEAQGSYDAAVAARSGISPADISTTARNTYRSAYTTLDTILTTQVDTFYGQPEAQGPEFLINPAPFDQSYFPEKRQAVTNTMDTWKANLATADSRDPQALLTEAANDTAQVSALLVDMATAANKNGTDASPAQLAALASARAGVATLASSITAAQASNLSQGTSASAGAAASVEIALGGLRAAQAALEKTLIRAPIGGTLNFMPLHVGDYVTALEHAATVAQNGALEVVAFVSEDEAALLAPGQKVMVEDQYPAVVTSVAPALDPVTKQVEVHVALTGTSTITNGQSVHIALPSAPAQQAATSTGPLLLPLTTLKLTPSARVVFSVDANGRLVSHPVEIGEVRGDRIEITTPLPQDLLIVSDARGLSDGEQVNVASSTQ